MPESASDDQRTQPPAMPELPPLNTTAEHQPADATPTQRYGVPEFYGRSQWQPTEQHPKRRLGTGAIIGIAAATALIVGAGSAIGTWALLPDRGSDSDEVTSSEVHPVVGGDTNWSAVATAVEHSVVSVLVEGQRGTSQGSGVVWDADGHVVTNNHVVEGGDGGHVIVTVGNRGYEATVLGTDPATDLAVLHITEPPEDLVPLTRGDSSALQVGDSVMAIGSPLGLSGSYTTGIVSALDRPVTTGQVNDNAVVTNAIQTSAALNPGNSGGALVNASGELVGINSSIATLGASSPNGKSGSIGIGFAIPVKLVENVVNQIIPDGGEVQHAWLGSANIDGNTSFEGSLILGAEVKEVTPKGPAEAAGIKPGDLIVRINDQEVSSSTSLVGVVRTYLPGDVVKVTVIRDGKQIEMDVTLGTSPTLNG